MTTKAATSPQDAGNQDDESDNARRFESTLSRVLSIPKDELIKRETSYQASRRAKKRRAVRPSAR